jgi:hypothetical protein
MIVKALLGVNIYSLGRIWSRLAQHAAVIDSPLERGHVVLFSNNPMWRGQTAGSYFLVFNAILNFDNLNAGRKLDVK